MALLQYADELGLGWPYFRYDLTWFDLPLVSALVLGLAASIGPRRMRAALRPTWPLLQAMPWIVLVATLLLNQFALHAIAVGGVDWYGFYAVSNADWHLGEIGLALLGVSGLRAIAQHRDQAGTRWRSTAPHLLAGTVVFVIGDVLARRHTALAFGHGGIEPEEELAFVTPWMEVLWYGTIAVGVVATITIIVVAWRKRSC